MSAESLERFRRLVLEDVSLQEALRETPDVGTFVSLTVRLGEERGCSFNADDLEAALRASRRAWVERWLNA